MNDQVLVLSELEIRGLLDPVACIGAVERAFAIYADGGASLPGVIHLDVPEARGEVHIKAGYMRGEPYYAMKAASSFPENRVLGKPTGGGLVAVFAASTGEPVAVLLDNGYITDLRTAAAGAIAVKHLAAPEADTLAVIGTGIQARLQVQLIALVRSLKAVRVWGRNGDRALECVRGIENAGHVRGATVSVAPTVEAAIRGADLVVTVTASREPLVRSEWIAPGATVVAVGADGADKQELDVSVLRSAGRVVADSLEQCRRIGEIHHALDAGVLDVARVEELGHVVRGGPSRRRGPGTTVVDLTGVGVQDVAAASLVVARALEKRPQLGGSR